METLVALVSSPDSENTHTPQDWLSGLKLLVTGSIESPHVAQIQATIAKKCVLAFTRMTDEPGALTWSQVLRYGEELIQNLEVLGFSCVDSVIEEADLRELMKIAMNKVILLFSHLFFVAICFVLMIGSNT